MAKKDVLFKSPEIDFEKYDEIVLVSPVWAGRANIFMNQYLKKNVFKNKLVTIIGSADGKNKRYFDSYQNLLDESNTVVKHILYVKGSKTIERKV